MAYRIKLSETPQQAVRRAGLEQIERAYLAVSPAGEGGSSIHETRKCLKRIRALLRLVRPGLDEDDFRRENARYRDIARMLSPERDAHILPETLLKLEPYAVAADSKSIGAMKDHLRLMQLRPAASAAIGTAQTLLSQAKTQMADLLVNGDDFDPIEKGLRNGYRRGRKHFELAFLSATDENFHEWRKSVQLHWRHMALMSRAWPDMFAARVEAARQLSQILGDAQDLSVLIGHVAGLVPDVPAATGTERLVRLARNRQQQLRDLAQPRGAQLFSLSPKILSRSIIETWQAARVMENLPCQLSCEKPAVLTKDSAAGEMVVNAPEPIPTQPRNVRRRRSRAST